ncbi:MAG: TIGR04141 family sporadically distributed protein [Bacteroidales bacterium]|nr:TIGR04141 family sporadically distributed protein [Bacteroidales bacterium]
MAKTKISITLIKEGFTIKDVLKSGTSSILLPDGNKLFYKKNIENRPEWLDSFLGEDAPDNRSLKSKSVSAVIFYLVEVEQDHERLFAITFGFGRTLLNTMVTEERFGLITTLNTIDADKLRSIDTNTLDINPLKNRIQSGNLVGIDIFNVDKDKELLKSITGKATTDWYDCTMSGSDSLSVVTEFTYKNIKPFLLKCYEQYNADAYRRHFKWIDQMRQVVNGHLIRELTEKLLAILNSDDYSSLFFSVPEIVDWKNADRFQIGDSELYDDVDIELLKENYPKGFKKTTIRKNTLSLIDENGNRKQWWPLIRCISADFEYQDQRYLLNDGIWYKLHRDFVEAINTYYRETAITKDLELSDYNINSEATYNDTAAKEHPDILCLMDRKLKRIGGDPIEVCDLYSKDKRLIHVKHYTGSSVLSHLFNQGLVSAESIFDKTFRSKVQNKLKEGFEIAAGNEFKASDYEVVFVIAKNDVKRNELPEIPFFSKVTFRNVANKLKMYGYKVSIMGIPYTYVAP